MKSVLLRTMSVLLMALPANGLAQDDGIYQGYVEGDYLYVGLPSGGTLTDLNVQRGDAVNAGTALFQLDPTREQAVLRNKVALLEAARAEYTNMEKGLRQSEISSLEEQLNQAKAENELARRTLQRQRGLEGTGVASEQNLDVALASFDRTSARVKQVEAELVTARLGARVDLLEAKARTIQALDADVVAARWALEQRIAIARSSGSVEDIYYRPGEYVEPGKPVVSFLPPENIKVRFFIPETALAAVQMGANVSIDCDNCGATLSGQVIFISSKAEFTPPVIYSEEERAKLLFLVEARFEENAPLKPGQPVDVSFK